MKNTISRTAAVLLHYWALCMSPKMRLQFVQSEVTFFHFLTFWLETAQCFAKSLLHPSTVETAARWHVASLLRIINLTKAKETFFVLEKRPTSPAFHWTQIQKLFSSTLFCAPKQGWIRWIYEKMKFLFNGIFFSLWTSLLMIIWTFSTFILLSFEKRIIRHSAVVAELMG